MTSSIAILVKANYPTSAVAQSDLAWTHKVWLTHKGSRKWKRPRKDGTTGDDQPGASGTYTYVIEEPTREFLNVAFALKKPVENKTWLTWEARFMPDCDVIRCPKLDPIVESVLR